MGRRRGSLAALLAFAAAAVLAASVLLPAQAAAQSDGSTQPRIVGGSQTTIDRYPWQAAVVFSPAKRSGNAHDRQFCGGSVITTRIVITAAHCVYNIDPDCLSHPVQCAISDPGGDGTAKLDPNDVDVVVGRTTLSGGGGAEIGVQSVTYRSNYNPNYNNAGVPQNDVGYLVLSGATSQPRIQIAGADEGALWDPGSPVEISGWGSTQEGGGTVDTLRSANVQIIPDSTCASGSVYGGDFDPNTMVCAGYLSGGVDTCAGDSGGPLEASFGIGYRLVGITGWGVGCGRTNKPGVYTRAAGSVLRPVIAGDVFNLETANGLAHENIIGSLATENPASAVTLSAAAKKALKKCKRIHKKKKRRRCIKRVKKKFGL
jgi:secreted trypsin-like serine protease